LKDIGIQKSLKNISFRIFSLYSEIFNLKYKKEILKRVDGCKELKEGGEKGRGERKKIKWI